SKSGELNNDKRVIASSSGDERADSGGTRKGSQTGDPYGIAVNNWRRATPESREGQSRGWPRFPSSPPKGASLGRREKPLEPRREPVTRLLMAHDGILGHPVELDDPPLALARLVAVPGMRRHREGEKGALDRRDLGDIIGEAVGRAQEAQPAARRLPFLVHVDEHGDQLGL